MTQVFQLLAFVASVIGLVAFGFYRDKKEHEGPNDKQTSIYFPETQSERPEHRGAAMSRLL
jgi:hypothetical protein